MNLNRRVVEIGVIVALSIGAASINHQFFGGSFDIDAISDAKVCPVGPLFEQVLESQKKGDVLLIDARSRPSYIEGHIKGAIYLPYDPFLDLYDTTILSSRTVLKTAPIIIYSEGPHSEASQRLNDQLKGEGYTNIQIYLGGWPEWYHRGAPIEDGGL